MATSRHQLGHHERRRAARVAPGLLTYASFDGSNGGMVLDVSESGLAVVAALAVPETSVVNLSIAADATHEQIEVTGRVAWIAQSKRRLGIELIEVAGGAGVWKHWTSELSTASGGAGTSEGTLPGHKALAPVLIPQPLPTETPGPISKPELSPPGPPETPESTLGESRGPRAPLLVMNAASAAVPPPPMDAAPKKTLEVLPAKEVAAGEIAASRKFAQKSGVARTVNFSSLRAAGLAEMSEPATFAHVPRKSADSGRNWLIVGTILLVAGSFGLGILIGRNIIMRDARRSSAAAAETERPAATSPAEIIEKQTSPPRDAQMTGESAAPAPALAMTTHAVSASGPSDVTPAALPAKSTPMDQKTAGRSDAESERPGIELLVTPREGEEPLRVELPEEVLMKTPSMEIVSHRVAMVPGVKASGRRKVREEKLLFGPLLARVTPQPRPEALAAAGAAGSERVVTVRVTIEGDGHVSYVDPVSGPMTLMPSVMAAVREWQYGPSTVGREPVRTEADLTVKFYTNVQSF